MDYVFQLWSHHSVKCLDACIIMNIMLILKYEIAMHQLASQCGQVCTRISLNQSKRGLTRHQSRLPSSRRGRLYQRLHRCVGCPVLLHRTCAPRLSIDDGLCLVRGSGSHSARASGTSSYHTASEQFCHLALRTHHAGPKASE